MNQLEMRQIVAAPLQLEQTIQFLPRVSVTTHFPTETKPVTIQQKLILLCQIRRSSLREGFFVSSTRDATIPKLCAI